MFFCWFGIDFGREGWGQTNPRPLILGISHVAFQVPDFSKAIAFYQDILGYKAIRSRARNNQPAHLIFNVNDRQHLAVYAGLTAEQDERLLELALEVTDAEAMRLYLLRKGVKVPATLDQEPAGCLSFVVVDPENHTVRFIQHQHKSKHQRHRIKKPEPAVSDRILHVGLTVADVKKMDAFYQEILGFSEIWRGGRPDSVTNWINMRVPEGTDY
ncbi:MAG: hypothetical protein JWQ14_3517, partial [Adhaeribacter sp.]|nr:hypothetical protein [Adhaeribacter sp.]